MSVTAVYLLNRVKIGATNFEQLANAALQTNEESLDVTPAGYALQLFSATLNRSAQIPLTTHQIAGALTEVGLGTGTDTGVIDMEFAKAINKSGRVARSTAEHVRYRATSTLSYISSIAANNKQQATVEIAPMLLKDGANPAYTYTGNNALTGVPAANENFVLGPIAVNGVEYEGANDFQLNMNTQMLELNDVDHETEQCAAIVDSIRPEITFTTTNPDIWTLDKQNLPGPLKVNLRRKENRADSYADTATQHIVFSVRSDHGRIVCEEIGGPGIAKTRVRIPIISSFTGDPFVRPPVSFAINSAIDISANEPPEPTS